MRTLTIALIASLVFLFSHQLTAADDRDDREERGASQAVVTGFVACANPIASESGASLEIGGELGVVGTTGLYVFVNHTEECSALLPALAERVAQRICAVGNTDIETHGGGTEGGFNFVCTGRADAVISAVGQIAKAVTTIGQP